MKAYVYAGLVAAGLTTGGYALAHHSFAAEFDANNKVELSGIVTKVEWTNPHVWFYINVKDPETGEVANWGAEMGPPHGLQRSGWRRETLKIGEQVTVNGFVARNGSNRLSARSVTLTATGGRPGQTLDGNSSIDQGN
jgi:primosomal replication protein N